MKSNIAATNTRLTLIVISMLVLSCNTIFAFRSSTPTPKNTPVIIPNSTTVPTSILPVEPQMSQSSSCPSAPDGPAPQSSSFSDRFNAVIGEVQTTKMLMEQQQYAAAILCWDDVLNRVPEYADAYYQRSQSYRALTHNQHVQSAYQDYLAHALADLNQAISLAPEMGDYYFARYEIEKMLAENETFLVDQNFWYTQAYSDITLANRLGTVGELADRQPGFLLVDLERCDEAVNEFNRLLSINTHGPSAGLNTGLAVSAQCLGKYKEALKYIDYAIRLHPSFERSFARATILYNLGRLDEALIEVNKLIAEQKYYCGCRYYLRAIIYYDQGEKDLAQADIDFGTGQTWVRGGIRSYILGHWALDAGEREQGIALLQEAEASLTWRYGSLRKRVQQELVALNSSPLSLSISVPPTPTLIPVTPQVQPPTPIVNILDKPLFFQGLPLAYAGNSPMII